MCIVVYQNGSLVSYIDEGAKKVKITRNVINIEKHAFKKNSKFVKLIFTNKLQEIKLSALECCNVTKLKFPKSLKILGNRCFYNSPSITEISFNEGLTTIGDYAFSKSSITTLSIPSSVTSLGEGCFSECPNLDKVIISSNSKLERISSKAFTGCPLLKVIEAPQSLKEMIEALEGLPSGINKIYK